MKKNKSIIVGTTMVQVMGSRVLWYLSIVIAIYIGTVFFSNVFNDVKMSVPSYSLVSILADSSRYFFLVCGILSVSGFLNYFVSRGVTRKAYFNGNVYGIFLLAIMFTSATAVIYYIESLIFSGYENSFGQMALFFVKMVVDIILFYLIGWFIAVGFYHSNFVKGVGFILIAIAVVFIQSGIWGEGLPLAFLSIVTIQDFSPILIISISVFFISVFIYIIRQLTKNVTVKF